MFIATESIISLHQYTAYLSILKVLSVYCIFISTESSISRYHCMLINSSSPVATPPHLNYPLHVSLSTAVHVSYFAVHAGFSAMVKTVCYISLHAGLFTVVHVVRLTAGNSVYCT